MLCDDFSRFVQIFSRAGGSQNQNSQRFEASSKADFVYFFLLKSRATRRTGGKRRLADAPDENATMFLRQVLAAWFISIDVSPD
jgi:hypothetical protein